MSDLRLRLSNSTQRNTPMALPAQLAILRTRKQAVFYDLLQTEQALSDEYLLFETGQRSAQRR